ncbi:BTAD domain-containing putative transcriptional regulator [Agromyces sp. Soil535]|uniref:ATP-binding protein n=1 Tax=Agromyces sp. Soil535 TaxID=1736390 RepID=UPI00138F179C|nr:BTAD domain-containing putative transcriptional regulator [Agromyces sp. Soil535]
MPIEPRPDLRVGVLGPVLLEGRSGALIEPPGALAKALVAALAVLPRTVGGTVGIDVIADELWGDATPRNARAALQTLVSRVRAVTADDLIASHPGGYALAISSSELDLGVAGAADGEGSAVGVDEALALWRGEPALDLGDAPIAQTLAERAGALRLQLLARRAAARDAAGDHTGAADDLAVLMAASPANEDLVARRLRALAASGRRVEAIAEFGAFRERLGEELGVSPASELVELNAELLRADEQPRRGSVRIGVRAAANALIGRDEDIVAIERLLRRRRLVTVLGGGGLGKTRIAQEVAARADDPLVVVVELASIRTDDDVVLALASTLGVREASTSQRLGEARLDVRGRIIARLEEWPALLVLDNCEHVIEGAARWAADLLGSIASLRVLATSRSPLMIGAEQAYPLEALAADVAGPAVELFLERAVAARPAADLPLEAVARLCTRLDGLPLAIELAAARVRSMTVEQIEARLANRFALLAGGDRSSPARQRTLHAVIDWSWALLTPDERLAMARLSWFPDGFGLDAADAVTGSGDALWLLDGLIAQSLLSVAASMGSPAPRYRMLETVREFGQLRLTESGDEAGALAAMDAWAVALSTHALAVVRGPGQIEAFRTLDLEEDNLVAILRRAIADGRAETVYPVFATLAYRWTARSAHSEILAFGDAVLDGTRGSRPGPELAAPATLALTLVSATHLAAGTTTATRGLARLRLLARSGHPMPPWIAATSGFLLALPDVGESLSRLRAMSESDDPDTAVVGSIMMSQFAENEGDPATAREYALRAHELAQRLGDVLVEAVSSMMLAQLASQSGRPLETLRHARQARIGLERLDAEQDLLHVDWMIAGALVAADRLDEARVMLDAMAEDDRTLPDGMTVATIADLGLAEIAHVEGRRAESLAHARHAIAAFHDGRRRGDPWFLIVLAGFAARGALEGWPPDEVRGWAERLRHRVTATARARPGFTDKPVLGTVAIGWGSWAMHQPGLEERGLEMLALGERMSGRQDTPGLNLARLLAAAEARVGAERVAAARDAAAALTTDECAERAHELLATPVPPADAP